MEPTGEWVVLGGEDYYRIHGYHHMPPFAMTIASDTDLWMFVTSGGGLTAGRVDAGQSLFPYETVDKLHDAHHYTGPISLFRVRRDAGAEVLWEPFAPGRAEDSHIERNLYKNSIGSRLVFEEIHHGLGLAFRYRWSSCDEFGLVRSARLENLGHGSVSVSLLDGLRNILPHGAPLYMYQQSSNLVDAYRRTDCDPKTQMAIFSLTSKISDRTEPAEELRATAVWCVGLKDHSVCLSINAIEDFRHGRPVFQEAVLKGQRGNYLLAASVELDSQTSARWHIVADVGRSHIQIAALRARLLAKEDLSRQLDAGLAATSEHLLHNVASADGIQLTSNATSDAHHFANVLFNNMRGGVFDDNYNVPREDFLDFLQTRQFPLLARLRVLLDGLPKNISVQELLSIADATQDVDFYRLCHEYLPLHFGRRHGDPSRPWNQFEIRVRNPDGSRTLRYQGNWRDIFQNWESLCLSFPHFLPSIIAKFVNASTIDGFNPYRITRDGIDWEVHDPHHAFSNIGYWGDHQIIYLLKFLEALSCYAPGSLEVMLERKMFSYAQVPYRVKQYADIVRNPRETIDYDQQLAQQIEARVATRGTDGKLLHDALDRVHHVTLLEKLLVPLLSKLSNFVLDGGIWMNTQRPEWNDANNALAGHGVSVVTLCYLRRYTHFLKQLVERAPLQSTQISAEVVDWFGETTSILLENEACLEQSPTDPTRRRKLLDELGGAFAKYREHVYAHGLSQTEPFSLDAIGQFCRVTLHYLEHAIHGNLRSDNLYHSYNLLDLRTNGRTAKLSHMHIMLEGQVAALSSGVVDASEAVQLVAALFRSPMYREDQKSFQLYPETELPGFLERNVVPDSDAMKIPLLSALLSDSETSIAQRDALGVLRFHPDFRNASDLDAALGRLSARERWRSLVQSDGRAVLDLFELVFDHESFKGRSGRMYAYEGLGSIYWQMVAKLLLAIQEIVLRESDLRPSDAAWRELAKSYYRVRAGLGFERSVADYGAFPTDPYSHTPRHMGAQQPGMTGQVKEEILTRFGELGVRIEAGRVRFQPVLLRRVEFRNESGLYRYFDLQGRARALEIPAGALAFSFCQVPIVYTRTDAGATICVVNSDGSRRARHGNELEIDECRPLFARIGRIERIEVGVTETGLHLD